MLRPPYEIISGESTRKQEPGPFTVYHGIRGNEPMPRHMPAHLNGYANPVGPIHTADTGAQFANSANGWVIRLTDPAEMDLFGTEWIPLPLAASDDLETVRNHVNNLRGF
jgi:hypothetical protein